MPFARKQFTINPSKIRWLSKEHSMSTLITILTAGDFAKSADVLKRKMSDLSLQKLFFIKKEIWPHQRRKGANRRAQCLHSQQRTNAGSAAEKLPQFRVHISAHLMDSFQK